MGRPRLSAKGVAVVFAVRLPPEEAGKDRNRNSRFWQKQNRNGCEKRPLGTCERRKVEHWLEATELLGYHLVLALVHTRRGRLRFFISVRSHPALMPPHERLQITFPYPRHAADRHHAQAALRVPTPKRAPRNAEHGPKTHRPAGSGIARPFILSRHRVFSFHGSTRPTKLSERFSSPAQVGHAGLSTLCSFIFGPAHSPHIAPRAGQPSCSHELRELLPVLLTPLR